MTPQELKNSILQRAIEGRLVEQRAEEGTGAELFEKIQKEKKELIREGKIKKQKSLEEIKKDEIPFDIPETWKWVRLGDVFTLEMGQSPIVNSVSSGSEGIEFHQGKVMFGNKFILESDKKTTKPTKLAEKNSILLCVRAPVGKINITPRKICIGRGLCSINPININLDFAYYLLVQQENSFVKQSTGTTFKAVSKEIISNQPIPLPPLEEQKRIVEKIEELMPLVDEYEENWQKLEEFNQRFPEDMKKSLLQEAIKGKLVEQRKEEGTGAELYKLINKNEIDLIKRGIIKKEKELPDIKEEEYLFEIPKSWTWVRFGELGRFKKGPFGSALTKDKFVPKGENTIKVYEQKNAIRKDATIGDYYITKEYFEEKLSGFSVSPGDILVSCAGTIGETFVMPPDIEKGIINQALMRMTLFEHINTDYFLIYFDYVIKNSAKENSKGSAIKNIPPFSILKNYLFALPPLAEQKRIVDRLEELLPLCDKLIKNKEK